MNPTFPARSCIVALAAISIMTGCKGRTASDDTQSHAYRMVTSKDALECGYRTSEVSEEYSFDHVPPQQVPSGTPDRPQPIPSGTLTEFHCVDSHGIDRPLELASYKMVHGTIETKRFGTIYVDGSFIQGTHLYLTEDQIHGIKEFLRK